MYKVGNKTITLSNSDYVGEGGEGQVYVKGPFAYKVYFKDPLCESKFRELSVLDKDNILKPTELMYKSNKLVGYSMPYVPDTEPLPRFFTTSFWQRMGIKTTFPLVEEIAKTIEYVHSKDIVIVDGNELNYLVKNNIPYFIDVDSWQTKSFPAKVIMPSIRDWHNPFSKGSDWFSFAIIATQLLLGIHPYKGKYTGTLEERMKNNISIFHSGVGLPPSVRDFGLVPKEYMKWLTNVLEDGKRLPPPNVAQQNYVAKTKVIVSKLKVSKVREYKNIQSVTYNGGWIVYTDDGAYFNSQKIEASDAILNHGKLIHCNIKNGLLYVDNKATTYAAKSLMTYKNELFVLQEDKFFKVSLINNVPIAGAVTNFLPHSTKKMRGCIYSDILGVPHAYLPDGNVIKLNKGKIIDVKYDRKLKVQYLGDDPLDFVVFDNGLCVYLQGDKLILDNGVNTKEILDSGIPGNLITDGLGLYFYDRDAIYKVSM